MTSAHARLVRRGGRALSIAVVHRWKGVAAVCAVLVVPATACSDSGSSSAPASSSAPVTSPPVPLTKVEYIDQANAICDTRNDQLQSLPPAGDDQQLVASSLLQAAGLESRALTQLRKLAIPAGDEGTLNPIYDKVELLLAKTSDLAAAYRAGNVPKAKDLQAQALQLQKEANDAATAYGMTSC